MKIKIVTGYEGECLYQDISYSNIKYYCEKNGYTLVSKYSDFSESLRHPYWRKLELIRENFFDCDYLMWMDADCLIINTNKKIEEIIDNHNDFFITKEDVVQAGCFIVKCTEEVKEFLDYWWEKGKTEEHWTLCSGNHNDNTVLTEIFDNKEEKINLKYYSNFDFVTKHVHYHDNKDCFIVHVVGSPEIEKLEFLSKFEKDIKC